ncbi:MAG: flavodoxin domain-containing protein [Oleiphilaceae bacterium]|nr:flavodoxin domain-containing protein [Oleiphilaceae bacterium]
MSAIRLFCGSVFGSARELALDIQEALEDQGLEVLFFSEPRLADFTAAGDGEESSSPVLVVTATTGEGELPEDLRPLYHQLQDTLPMTPGRPYGLVALGDSAYRDSYCGAADLVEALFDRLAMAPLKPTLRIDAGQTTDPHSEALPWALDWAERLRQRP